jgi:hypothetical protein
LCAPIPIAMDSVPRDSQPSSPAQLTEASELQSELGDRGDDPFSQGPQALSSLLGSLIALTTAVVPLAMVVSGRPFSSPAQGFDGSGAALQQKSLVAESLKNPGRISKASRIDEGR